MVHFRSTATFLAATFSVIHLAIGREAPTGPGTALTFHVLTGTSEMACSAEQIPVLKTRLTEAITLAKAASGALKVKGVKTSPAFMDFLGNVDPKEMDAQHYAPIASIQSVDLRSVTSNEGHRPGVRATAPVGETLFMCYPASELPCTQDGKATGIVAVADAGQHAVKLCPLFFGGVPKYNSRLKMDVIAKSLSLADGKAMFLAGKGAYALKALVLLHEFQHLPSVVGEHWVRDLWIKAGAPGKVLARPENVLALDNDVVAVYRKHDCIGLPQDKKRLNAQNIAYFALDVYSDPVRAQPHGDTSGTAKTPKRFERRSDKRAAVYNSQRLPNRFLRANELPAAPLGRRTHGEEAKV